MPWDGSSTRWPTLQESGRRCDVLDMTSKPLVVRKLLPILLGCRHIQGATMFDLASLISKFYHHLIKGKLGLLGLMSNICRDSLRVSPVQVALIHGILPWYWNSLSIRLFVTDKNFRNQLGVSTLRDLKRTKSLTESVWIFQSRRRLLLRWIL